MESTVEEHGFKTDYLNNEGKVIKLEEEGRLSLFFRSFVDFLNEYSLTDHIEVEYEDSLYKRLQDKLKDKEKFWFDFKEKYGDVLIEGFYHNDLESKPEKLLEYADLYFRTYKKPKDDYSIEYLDASDVLGTEVKNIDVGDYISLSKQDIDFVDKLNSEFKNMVGGSYVSIKTGEYQAPVGYDKVKGPIAHFPNSGTSKQEPQHFIEETQEQTRDQVLQIFKDNLQV